MPLHTFIHNLLNVLVQIANKMGLQKKKEVQGVDRWPNAFQATVHFFLFYS
jgi:hypothetical protein